MTGLLGPVTADELLGLSLGHAEIAKQAAHGPSTDEREALLLLRVALVEELEALRLTIRAVAAPPPDAVAERSPSSPAVWARVELFGHTVRYGEVAEVERFGRRWLEVTAPAQWKDENDRDPDNPDVPEERKLYHPNAVYAMEDVGEDSVRQTLRRIRGLDVVHRLTDDQW